MYKSVFWINRRTSSFVQWSPRVLGCGFREQEHDANNSGANWEHSKLAFHHQVRCYTCCWVLSVGSAVGMLSMWNLCCRLLDQWRQWTCYQCPGARVTFFAGENGEESGPVVAIFCCSQGATTCEAHPFFRYESLRHFLGKDAASTHPGAFETHGVVAERYWRYRK